MATVWALSSVVSETLTANFSYIPRTRGGGGVGVREGRCFALAGGEGFQWNFEFYVFLMLFYAFETRFWSFFKKNYS